MKHIFCKNYREEQIDFTYDLPFHLISVEGIHDIVGTINTTAGVYDDGESYDSTVMNKRNIVITGFIANNYEENRKKLYKVFALKSLGTFIYRNEEIEKTIHYYTESVHVDEIGIVKNFQISLICPKPNFREANESQVVMARWVSLWEFPVELSNQFEFAEYQASLVAEIENTSSIPYGMDIRFIANADVISPTLFNLDTREFIKVDFDMKAGDIIHITTYTGSKDITLIRNNIVSDINMYLTYDSKFLAIHPGLNAFRYDAEKGIDNLTVDITYIKEYEAI